MKHKNSLLINKKWSKKTTSTLPKNFNKSHLEAYLPLLATSTPSQLEYLDSLLSLLCMGLGRKIHLMFMPIFCNSILWGFLTLRSSILLLLIAQDMVSPKAVRKQSRPFLFKCSRKFFKLSTTKLILPCLVTLKEELPYSMLSMKTQQSLNFWSWSAQSVETFKDSENFLCQLFWSMISKMMVIPFGRENFCIRNF